MAFTDNFFTPVPGGATYNVREAIMWAPYGADKVIVRFASQPNTVVVFDLVAWFDALSAAQGSGF